MATKEINSATLNEKNKDAKAAVSGSNGDYTADSIKVLGGVETVRKRPAMYICSTGGVGLHHPFYEILENSVDQTLSGDAHKNQVTIHIEKSGNVLDNG